MAVVTPRRLRTVLASVALMAPLAAGVLAPEPAHGGSDLIPTKCWGRFDGVRDDGRLAFHAHIEPHFYAVTDPTSEPLGFVPTAWVQHYRDEDPRGVAFGWATTRSGTVYRVVRRRDQSDREHIGLVRVASGWTGTKALVVSDPYLYRFSGSFVRRYTVTPGRRLTDGVTVAYGGYGSVRTASLGGWADPDPGDGESDRMHLTTSEGRLERLEIPHDAPSRERRTVVRRTGFGSFRAFSVGFCQDAPRGTFPAFFLGVTSTGHVRGYYDPDQRDGLAELRGAQVTSATIPYRVYSSS